MIFSETRSQTEQTCSSGLTGKGRDPDSALDAWRNAGVVDSTLIIEEAQAPQHRHRGPNYFYGISLDTFLDSFSISLLLGFLSFFIASGNPVIKHSPKPASVRPSHWPGYPALVPAISFLSIYTSTLHTSRSWDAFLYLSVVFLSHPSSLIRTSAQLISTSCRLS